MPSLMPRIEQSYKAEAQEAIELIAGSCGRVVRGRAKSCPAFVESSGSAPLGPARQHYPNSSPVRVAGPCFVFIPMQSSICNDCGPPQDVKELGMARDHASWEASCRARMPQLIEAPEADRHTLLL